MVSELKTCFNIDIATYLITLCKYFWMAMGHICEILQEPTRENIVVRYIVEHAILIFFFFFDRNDS